MTKGSLKYVPKEMIERLESYKKDFNLKDSEAFRRLVTDSKIGKDIRLTIDFNMNGYKRKRR